jgi:hypothetical protein
MSGERFPVRTIHLLLLFSCISLYAQVDNVTWIKPEYWNCRKTAIIESVDGGSFSAPEPRSFYTAEFENELVKGLMKNKILDTVYFSYVGITYVPDLKICVKYLQLDEGDPQKRMAIGYGAGTSKCEIELIVKVQDTEEKVFDLVHERISPLGFKSDELSENVNEIAADIINYFSENRKKCDNQSGMFAKKLVNSCPEMTITLKDGTKGRIYYIRQDTASVIYKREPRGNILKINKSLVKIICTTNDTIYKTP